MDHKQQKSKPWTQKFTTTHHDQNLHNRIHSSSVGSIGPAEQKNCTLSSHFYRTVKNWTSRGYPPWPGDSHGTNDNMKPCTNNFFWCPKRSLSIQINLSQYSCVKRSLVASSSHAYENLNYKTTTKLHVFKHAINPQKCFIFSYRPQTHSNNIWPIPAEQCQCCLLFSLELQNSREWIAFPFECCIKTRLLIFSSHF